MRESRAPQGDVTVQTKVMRSTPTRANPADGSALQRSRRSGGTPVAAKACGLRYSQRGFIISAEAMLFATILVLGTIGGWVAIRNATNAELIDFANALSYSVPYFSDPNRGETNTPALEYSLEPCVLEDAEMVSESSYQCIPTDWTE